ncbi:MAG: hypothetical protein COA65_09670 [Rhodospirillaceae bacterium]|nr:MAG: hypothetical protein COA65_09670 [Rhodospirillaceae bacterium]
MKTNSKRKYEITLVERGSTDTAYREIGEIINSDKEGFEFEYALQDIIDEVLDLGLGHSMYFQSNRDNTDSKGIIVRIR